MSLERRRLPLTMFQSQVLDFVWLIWDFLYPADIGQRPFLHPPSNLFLVILQAIQQN